MFLTWIGLNTLLEKEKMLFTISHIIKTFNNFVEGPFRKQCGKMKNKNPDNQHFLLFHIVF